MKKTVEKVLRLSGGEWYLLFKDGTKERLKKNSIKKIVDQGVDYIRVAYLKSLPFLYELDEKGKVKLKQGKISSKIYNIGITGKTFSFTVNGHTLYFYNGFFQTSLEYFLEKDIKKNLLQGKAIAIKSIPIVRQAREGVLESIDFEETGNQKRIKVSIKLRIFKEATLLWEAEFSKRKSTLENSYLKILERIKNGEYQLSYAGFGYKERGNKKGPYIILSYKVPVVEREKRGRIMGLDLGQECLVYYAISDSHSRGDLTKDSEFTPEWLKSEKFDWKKKIYSIWTKRRSLVRELHNINNLIKQGVMDENLKKRKQQVVKELDAIRNYEANFMETLNKTIASVVKKIAEKEGVELVVMEDLSIDPEKKTSLMFPKWNYGQLQTYIENKLQEIGVQVKKINPAGTSLRCPECGYIGFMKEVVRPERSKFICPSCGYKAHADYVGAKNLSIRDIEEKINEYLKTQIKKLSINEYERIKEYKPDNNHRLFAIWRKLLRQKLCSYLNIPENTSLRKALKLLKRNDTNFYREVVKNPAILNGANKLQ